VKATYTPADAAYMAKRGLRRYASAWHLWAMGVGAVISGDFFGWNYGLAAGGFGGMMLAVAVMTVMYIGLCFSIAEMSAALPHAGGAYSFARTAMGPWGGYITGLAENMEYVLTPAVIVVGVGGYLGSIFGVSSAWDPLWWALCYAVFVSLNIWGVDRYRCAGALLDRCGAAFRSGAVGAAILSGGRGQGSGGRHGIAVCAVALSGH
jgi:ethanolamine permease